MRINSVVLNVFVLIYKLNIVLVTSSSKIDLLHAANLPPCRACRTIVDSFNKGFEQTSKSKFEGGDTAWEEEKLGSYATSEIRLVEIQENLCKDIEEGRNQCFSLAEQHDSLIEDWWFQYQKQQPDLQHWLCIENLQVCCPENHFGLECDPCPGYPDVCSNNGKCKGAGTRKGNGMCICDAGYAGQNCSECADKYYVAYKDDAKLLCSKCHISCDGSCTGAGHKGCIECAAGWSMALDRGCLDVNECAFEKSPCGRAQFCVNTDGSFKCLDCDRACSGCSGDGPDMCDECTAGYSLIDNVCMDTSQRKMTSYVNFTRYLTYIGLCVATCIILQRNLIIAAVVGLVVALYISVSEYMLSTRSDSSDTIIDSDSLLRSIG